MIIIEKRRLITIFIKNPDLHMGHGKFELCCKNVGFERKSAFLVQNCYIGPRRGNRSLDFCNFSEVFQILAALELIPIP